MIEREVQVVEVMDDHVWVEAQKTSACSHCSVSSSCGTSVLSKWMQKKNRILLSKTLDLHAGDRLIVGVTENDLLKVSILVYLLPIIFVLVAAVLVSNYTNNQGLIALSGLVGLGTGFYISRRSTGGECPVVLLRKVSNLDPVTSIEIQEV